MLEFIRRRSTSFLSWIILGGIAVVFGLQFGLPSDSLTLGPGGLAEVHGKELRNEDFTFQVGLASRFGLVPKEAQMRELVGVNEEIIDGMVERILLAHEARKMGLAATVSEAEDMVLDGHVMLFGNRLEWLGPDEKFNYDIFTKNWLGPMRVAEPHYLTHQSEELLAQTLRDLVSASVVVPESEIRRQYELGANTLALRYARYEHSAFADLADPTPAQLDAYVTEHADELAQRYESQKTRFTGLPKQVRLQLVQTPDTPQAREALEQARADGRGLSTVARAQSIHDTARRGGDYGWMDEQSETASDLPAAIREALLGVPTDGISEVLEAEGSLWLLRVVDRREGDVPQEQALRELAEESVRDQLGADLARRAAEEDQNAVAGGTPLGEVFSQPGALGETTLFGGKAIEDLGVEGGAGDAAALARPKAELRSTGPFVKGQKIPGLGMVPDLLGDAWAHEGEAELLDGVYDVPGAVILAGVESKQQATDESYAEQRQAIYDGLRRMKADRVVGAWANRRCFDAKGRGDIKVSEETVKRLTTYDTKAEEGEPEAEEPPKKAYVVCERVGGGGGFLTARLRR